MLLGNKLDYVLIDSSRRKVQKEEAIQYANNNGILFKEVSAFENSMIEDAFEKLIETIYIQKQQVIKPEELSDLSINFSQIS